MPSNVARGRDQLSPDEFLAISILGRDAKNLRREVEPGKDKPIDMLLRIQGTITVGADGTTTSTKKPSAEQVLAYLLRALPVEAAASVEDAIQALPAGGDSLNMPEELEGFTARARSLIGRLAGHKTSPRKGSTSGVFNIGLVDLESLAPTVSTAVTESTRAIRFDDDEDEQGKVAG